MLFILAFVLLIVLSTPWDLIGFAVCLVLGVGELFGWYRPVSGRQVAAGAETLIGAKAKVVVPCRPDGQVRVDGELWDARCTDGADRGETVRVVGRRGLTLTVERV
jgi:membrane protein implicated in regulation of membrane protease activity